MCAILYQLPSSGVHDVPLCQSLSVEDLQHEHARECSGFV